MDQLTGTRICIYLTLILTFACSEKKQRPSMMVQNDMNVVDMLANGIDGSDMNATEITAGELAAGEPAAGEPTAGEPAAGEPAAGEEHLITLSIDAK